jgi:septum formation protein
VNPLLSEEAQRDLILASSSPRRIEILRGLGFDFRVEPAQIDEEIERETTDPFEFPLVLARLKAERVARRFPEATVIGADTLVILNGEVFNKPRDDREAVAHLKKLSGAVHTVVTGLAVTKVSAGVSLAEREETRVRFRELDDEEIAAYIDSGEGRDKAGAYAVQGLGGALVRSIEGCYYNVVGLPVPLFFELLKRPLR